MSFASFGLKKGIMTSLSKAGYHESTPIQQQVLEAALDGSNIVGQSQTGSGKTAAFLLPILQQMDTNDTSLQALIIAPTRELVVQISEEIGRLTTHYGVRVTCLYGGASPNVQKKNLLKKPSIVVATPGRLMDFMRQGVIDVSVVSFFVLDEVDRMLDMGFVRDITKIWKQLKQLQQTLLFSATMNDAMKKIINKHLADYVSIKIGEEVTVDQIDHRYLPMAHSDKLYNVVQLLYGHPGHKVIIFTHTKRNADTIHQILLGDGFKICALHGDMSQAKRLHTLRDFRDNKMRILVTTDVAARGLNMHDVGLVINMEVPSDAKSYIHRIGRTGRAGASGKAIMLMCPEERSLLKAIEMMHRIKIDRSRDHQVWVDENKEYSSIKLNRSTDKPGKRKSSGRGRGRRGPTRRSGKGKKKQTTGFAKTPQSGRRPGRNTKGKSRGKDVRDNKPSRRGQGQGRQTTSKRGSFGGRKKNKRR